MLIGIDGNEANVEKRVGIGEYSFELLRKFKEFQISIRQPADKFQIYLKDKPLKDFPQESSNWHYRMVKPRKFWTQFGLPLDLFLKKPRPNVFFSPSHYAPRFSPIPTAISVMDLSYIHFPELFTKKDLYQLQSWTTYSVRNAKKVFTISQASKNDIIKYYDIPPENVVVTYPGIKQELRIMNSELRINNLRKKYTIREKYILFVGTIQPRKNIERLITAFSKVDLKGIDLLIVGKKGWLYEPILQKPKELGIEDKVKFLNFVSDEELDILYQHAICYILPSLYEGFGLPVLEAMQHGCPVITSNVSSLPEAGGDAVLYIDPENVDDIVDKMIEMIENEKLRKELIEKGYKQMKKFSWEKTARETLKVLEEIVK